MRNAARQATAKTANAKGELTAVLRERPAEDSQNSSDSSDSVMQFVSERGLVAPPLTIPYRSAKRHCRGTYGGSVPVLPQNKRKMRNKQHRRQLHKSIVCGLGRMVNVKLRRGETGCGNTTFGRTETLRSLFYSIWGGNGLPFGRTFCNSSEGLTPTLQGSISGLRLVNG